MSNANNKEVEVNGKIDLGTRRLFVSHVENASTFYAYQEADKGAMDDIKVVMAAECSDLPRLSAFPKLEILYGILFEGDKQWYRSKVEKVDEGTDKKQVRLRMVDFGWNEVVQVSAMCQLPQDVAIIKIRCEKYKMANLKPKGRNEGYTAADRQKGADWLEKTIEGRVVVASCHKLVKYEGGIQADCMVGRINLNQAAIKQGHVITVKDKVQGTRGNNNNLFNHQHNQRNVYNYNMGRGQGMGYNMGGPVHFGRGGVVGGQVMNGRGGGAMGNQGKFAEMKKQGVEYDEAKNVYTINVPPGIKDPINVIQYHLLPRHTRENGPRGNQSNIYKNTSKGQGKEGKSSGMKKQAVENNEATNQLEKITNLDQGIKVVASLLDQVTDVRKNAPEKAGPSKNKTLISLVGVAETIKEAVGVMETLKSGVEAVEAAGQITSLGDKVDDKEGDALKVAELQTRTNLYKCINKFIVEYSQNAEAVSEAIQRVDSQINGMTATIPARWKLLAVRADKVTKDNFLEVAGNVSNWVETAATNESVLAVNTNKQVDNLTKSLTHLAEGIKARHKGNKKAEIPTNMDVIFLSTKAALTAEISSSGLPSSIKPRENRKNKEVDDEKVDDISVVKSVKEVDDSSMVRSAWRALTALKSQLEMIKNKNVEYGNKLTALEPQIAA